MNRPLNQAQRALLGVDRFFARIARALWLAGGACIVLMALVVGYGAIARYVFRNPVAVSYDLTCLLMLFCVMLALPYVQYTWSHLRLNLFDNVFAPVVTRIITTLFAPLLGLGFGVVLCWKCWDAAVLARTVGERTKGTLELPSFPIKLLVAILVGLLCIIFLLQLLKFCFGIREEQDGTEPPAPDTE